MKRFIKIILILLVFFVAYLVFEGFYFQYSERKQAVYDATRLALLVAVHDSSKTRLDGWGREIRVITLPDGRKRASSAGPDGDFGTGDDMTEFVPKSKEESR